MMHTLRQSIELQAALNALLAQFPALLRLSDRRMTRLVRELSAAYDQGLRGDALVAALVRQ